MEGILKMERERTNKKQKIRRKEKQQRVQEITGKTRKIVRNAFSAEVGPENSYEWSWGRMKWQEYVKLVGDKYWK